MHLGGVPYSLQGAISPQQPLSGNANSVKESSRTEESFEATLRAQLDIQRAGPRKEVSLKRTQLSASEASEALKVAWKQHFGSEPPKETVAVLTAQWSHETGNGRSMFNFNFGGIKGTGPSGLTVASRTREGWGASERTIVDNFRAYSSASEGASDYLSLLRRKYPKAVEAAAAGDPAGFVRSLKKGGYFTGNEGAYVRSVSTRASQLLEAPLSSPPALSSSLHPQSPAAPQPTFQAVALARPGSREPLLAAESKTLPSAPSTSSLDLRAFDDALSRAALRIALSPREREDWG